MPECFSHIYTCCEHKHDIIVNKDKMPVFIISCLLTLAQLNDIQAFLNFRGNVIQKVSDTFSL